MCPSEPPSISSSGEIVNQTVLSGFPTELECKATGSPLPGKTTHRLLPPSCCAHSQAPGRSFLWLLSWKWLYCCFPYLSPLMEQRKIDLRWLPTGSFALSPLPFFPVYKFSTDKQSHSSVIEHSFLGTFLHFTAGVSIQQSDICETILHVKILH